MKPLQVKKFCTFGKKQHVQCIPKQLVNTALMIFVHHYKTSSILQQVVFCMNRYLFGIVVLEIFFSSSSCKIFTKFFSNDIMIIMAQPQHILIKTICLISRLVSHIHNILLVIFKFLHLSLLEPYNREIKSSP